MHGTHVEHFIPACINEKEDKKQQPLLAIWHLCNIQLQKEVKFNPKTAQM